MKNKTSKFALLLVCSLFLFSILTVTPVHAQYSYAYVYGSGGTYTITDVTLSTSSSGASGTFLQFIPGDQLTFQVSPAGGKAFSYWTDGSLQQFYTNPSDPTYFYGDISLTAIFTTAGVNTYYINSTSADSHSVIAQAGLTGVTEGNTQQITWTVDPGYQVVEVNVDGFPYANIASPYTFTNVVANHTLTIYTEATTVANYAYTFSGPYYDDGTSSGDTISATAYWVNNVAQHFYLTEATGSITLNSNSPITTMTWNCSSTLNETRRIDFQPLPTNQNFTLFITNPSSPSTIYTFPITDFYGMTNPFLETQVSIGGTLYTTEQVNTNNIGSPNFIMQQYQTYTLTFNCKQGSYSQQFTAGTTTTNTLPVLAGAFPTTNTTYPEADAARLSPTTIGMIYADPAISTDTVNFLITHQSGATVVIDYNNTFIGTSQNNTWTQADAATSYTVTITASISNATSAYGSNPQWIIIVPETVQANPWLGAFDWLGQYTPTLPYTPTGWTGANGQQLSSGLIAEFVGMAIIMLFLGVGSYRSSGVTCIIAWLMSGILLYLGWWANGITGGLSAIPSFALCGVIAIFITLSESKQTEREV